MDPWRGLEEQDDAQELTCCVCMKRVHPRREARPPCDHRFCVDCALDWAQHHAPPSCPLCKQPFSTLRTRLLLDGSLATDWAEESVALLLRCHWRQSALPSNIESKMHAASLNDEPAGVREPPFDDAEEEAWEHDGHWDGYCEFAPKISFRTSRSAARAKKHGSTVIARPLPSASAPAASSKPRSQRTELRSSQSSGSSRVAARGPSSDQADWVRPVYVRMD
jgi:hypothetical protein